MASFGQTKLTPAPADLAVDAEPGTPEWLPGPGRPPGLEPRRGREVSVPPIEGMRDPDQRARILHAMANHELQAAELFAWALCAFADAPRGFRTGLWAILADEQRHARRYFARAEALGRGAFDCPVTGHFWNYRERLTSPLAFVCTMGLTFENANLDLAAAYAQRWEIESTFDELKTHQRGPRTVLRSSSRARSVFCSFTGAFHGGVLEAIPCTADRSCPASCGGTLIPS